MKYSRLKTLARAAFAVCLSLGLWAAVGWNMSMPGKSYSGPLRPLTDGERTVTGRLHEHVRVLSEEIGERCVWTSYPELLRAADYVEHSFGQLGYENVASQRYEVEGVEVRNIEVTLPAGGSSGEIVVIGAHYDSALDTPAANDNGSGVAALLELARLMKNDAPQREVRFVAFVNEESPFFQTGQMGSARYAKRCSERDENVVAMLSLETIGYYSDEPGSQQYPPLLRAFYPDRGDFITFVGNLGSRALVRRCTGLFRESTPFPSEGAALPGWLPGVSWSDQWSFWQEGYQGVMVTDTAPFRYPHYHEREDTIDKIDFHRLARVVSGLTEVVRGLAGVRRE